MRAQAIEVPLPELPEVQDPFCRGLERFSLEPAGSPLGLPAARYQPCAFQDFQVLRDRGAAYAIRLGQLANRRFAKRKSREKAAPRRVGNRR